MIDLHLIDYNKCHEYARSLCGQFDIPRCDVEDIGSDAFLEAIKRAWHAEAKGNPVALARRLMYTTTLDVIRRRNTFDHRVISDATDIDATQEPIDREPTDDEAVEPESWASRLADNTENDPLNADWENPFWLRLFNLERQKLRNNKRKLPLAKPTLDVIKEGLKDSRLSLVKEKLRFSGTKFQTVLSFFKERFDLCFQALRQYRTQK